MTVVGNNGTGYFSDPYPVRLDPALGGATQLISGTTKAIMRCAPPIRQQCFSWTPITIDAGMLRSQIASAGATITNLQNLNAFQDDYGRWHALLAIGVHSREHLQHWTVLVHAHPSQDGLQSAQPLTGRKQPLEWSADTVLSGSFSQPLEGNYDGKYFVDGGRLYLLYVKNFVPAPALRNGIVIQPMLSPTRVAAVSPTTLLTPGDRFGSLNSEYYDHTLAKLVEAPYIVKIADKYALVYSTGAYQHADYKASVAWSDTLFPAPGSHYRKVLETDVEGVWGTPGQAEVHYLLQSQISRWPNFTASQVVSPGVASVVRVPGGDWLCYFAGFAPANRPMKSPGVAEADHRRPYFVRLRVTVPYRGHVATATDAELADWLKPETQ